MAVVVWLVLGVLLVAFEMHHLALYALFGAAGAFAAAIVAVFFPEAVAAQVLAMAVVTVLGIVAVRPRMSESLHRRQHGKLGKGVYGTLVGEEVFTLDVVGDTRHVGHVRLAGERWLAVSGSGDEIPAGEKVLVTEVQGTTLTVWPVGGGPVPELPDAGGLVPGSAGLPRPSDLSDPTEPTGPTEQTGPAAPTESNGTAPAVPEQNDNADHRAPDRAEGEP